MWPRKAEYQQAVQNPYGCFEDAELQTSNPELDASGLPRVLSGGTAAIFLLKCETRKVALRCFLTQTTDRQARFTAIRNDLLGLHLAPGSRTPNVIGFDYLQKGIRVKGNWYPILKMDWVEGCSLTDYIRDHGQDSAKIRELADKWALLSAAWRRNHTAHGNLQAANILVSGGEFRLVDYDGVYSPSLGGRPSEELGSPDYQHPGRNLSHFGEYLDNFSDWVIYTSLYAISVDPRFLKFVDYDERLLLFRKSDYLSPAESEVLFRLKSHPREELKLLGANMERLLASHIQQVPPLEPGKLLPHSTAGGASMTDTGKNQALASSKPPTPVKNPPFASTISPKNQPSRVESLANSFGAGRGPVEAAPDAEGKNSRIEKPSAADSAVPSSMVAASHPAPSGNQSAPAEKNASFGVPVDQPSVGAAQRKQEQAISQTGLPPTGSSISPNSVSPSAESRPRKHKDVLDLDEADRRTDPKKPVSHPLIIDAPTAEPSESFTFGGGKLSSGTAGAGADAADSAVADNGGRTGGSRTRLRGMGAEQSPAQANKGNSFLFAMVLLFLAVGGGGGAFFVFLQSKPALVQNSSDNQNDPAGTTSTSATTDSATTATTSTTGTTGTDTGNGDSEATASSPGTSTPKMDSTLCEEGKKYVQRKQFQSAVSKFELALKENPESAEAYGGRGDAFMGLKRYADALDDYNKALALEPDNKDFYKGRGWAYLSLEQFLKAIADYKKAISLDPRDPVLYSDLGRCYGGLNQYQQAIDYFNQSIERKETANTYYLRGGTYYCLQKYNEALADYKKATVLDPKDADAWYGIGSCYYCFKRYADADQPYRKAIALYKAAGNEPWAKKAEAFLKEVSASKN